MSIHAFGATYDGVDVSTEFLRLGVACSGWRPSSPPDAASSPTDGDATFIEAAMRAIKVADLAVIKSYSPAGGLRIKGVGLVTDARPHDVSPANGYQTQLSGMGTGVKVRWTWPDVQDGSVHWRLGTANDRGSHVRTGTIYEEYGPDIAAVIMDLLLDPTLRQ